MPDNEVVRMRVEVFLPDGTKIGEQVARGGPRAGAVATAVRAPIPGGLWVDVIAAAIVAADVEAVES